METIKNNMRAVVVCVEDTNNQDKWKYMTKGGEL